jgi:acyl-CoA reductase-like NAD-dependent aldehyde dehydrogenase
MKKIADLVRAPEGCHWVGGQWVKSLSGETYQVTNPATGEPLFSCANGNAADVDRAVKAARTAFEKKEWCALDAATRGELLLKVFEKIRQEKDNLCLLESFQNGKTLKEAGNGDLPPSWDIFRYYAGWADKLHGETIPVAGPYLNYTLRQPLGVVGAIVPWNYPLLLACWKAAPALAMGNTIVVKPAPNTPLTALALAGIIKEAGVPDGVFNVVTGGDETGAAITAHPDIDKVSFTGSIETARKVIASSASSNLKKLTLELGGKSPQILFADAEQESALDAVFWGIFANKGEICSAGSRLFLHEEIYDSFSRKLIARAKEMKVGDPTDPSSEMGSLSSKEQLERVIGYIEKGKREGAKLACGGSRLTKGELAKGFFLEPTIFTDVDPKMTIAQEEIFGPVLVTIPFRDEEEVVRICNSTPYGLVAAVWTKDSARGHRVAQKLQAGTVWINLYNGFDSASPFGGFKQSGWGREMGIHALEAYTQVKSIWVSLS